MPELSHSQKAATARFAHLAAVVRTLTDELELYEGAAELHQGLPKRQRTRIEATPEGAFAVDASFAIARTHPAEREARQHGLEAARQFVRSLIEDEDAIPMMQYDKDDLSLIIDFINSLSLMGVRSKREVARFFEAVETGDSASMVATSIPMKGHTRQKVEVRFAHELTDETRESLRLPSVMGSKQT